MKKPQQIKTPDLSELREAVQDYIDYIDSDEYHPDRDDKYENAVLERAVEALFGEEVYIWINKRIEEHEE